MRATRLKFGMAGILALTIAAPVICPQQQSQDQQSGQSQSQNQGTAPIPAYHSPLAGLSDNSDTTVNPAELQPDTRPLAGAQDLSIGELPLTHSYWEPQFNFTTTGDSNPLVGSGQGGWTTWSTMTAGIDFHRVSGNSDLVVNYMGGGEISNDGEAGNSVLQQFGFNDKIAWRRTTLTLIDQLNYVPDISLGYGALSGLSLPGGGSVGLQQGFLPGQSILTPEGERLTNSFIVQDDTYLTPRTSLTFVGGYSLMHYYGDNLLNMGDAIFQGGYNYQMTRKDTFAVLYRFSGYRYSNIRQSINDNMVQVSYGRRLTGKLAFQVAAGPEITFLQFPLNQTTTTGGTGGSGGSGSGGSGSTTSSSTRQIYWSLNSNLTYQLQNTGFQLSYSHGISGGSGVLAGAVGDFVNGTASRQLTRLLGGSVNVGYARNSGLNLFGTTPTNQTFGYWSAGAGLSRPFGRSLNMTLSYQLQYQNSGTPFCIGTTCETSLTRNMISLSFDWHSRPLTY